MNVIFGGYTFLSCYSIFVFLLNSEINNNQCKLRSLIKKKKLYLKTCVLTKNNFYSNKKCHICGVYAKLLSRIRLYSHFTKGNQS